MDPTRLMHEKSTYYSPGVLLGNWVEEKFGRYRKETHKHKSIYQQDFNPKYASDKHKTDEIRNDIQMKSAHANNFSPPKTLDEGSNYFDNFSTTYDLSFQYFPKWLPGSINRRLRMKLMKFEPSEEYLNGYGNLSSRNGLTNDKKVKWECDVLDPRRPVTSIGKSDFAQYAPTAYKAHRWPRLDCVKRKTGTAMDMPVAPTNHPRIIESRKNPITWEGYNDFSSVENCVCK